MQSEDAKITIPKPLLDGSNCVIHRNRHTHSFNTHGLDVHLTEAEPSQKYIAEGDVKNGTQVKASNADAQKKKRDVECHNCHKRSCIKAECWANGGGQEGKGPKRKGQAKEGTAAVAEPQLEAWAALEEVGDGQDHVAAAGSARANGRVETKTSGSGAVAKPQLEAWAALEEVGDGQDHVAAAGSARANGRVETKTSGSGAVAKPQLEAWAALEEVGDSQYNVAAAGSARANGGVETKVYDSGASRHMSPFREHFVPSKTIAPCAITAADKWVFYPIGVGDPKVKVPNEGDPKSLSEARSRADWLDWKAAMDRELETLEKAGTWRTVSRPEGKNIIGSKWVFRLKRKADGSIDKHKARLVMQSSTQIHGIEQTSKQPPPGYESGAVGPGHPQAAAQVPVWADARLDGNGMLCSAMSFQQSGLCRA